MRVLGIFAATFCALLCLAFPANADDRNINGGFEQGLSGWSGFGDLTCPQPRSGQLALALVPTGPSVVAVTAAYFVTQAPLPPGTYTLNGWMRVMAGSVLPKMRLVINFAGATSVSSATTLAGLQVSSTAGYTPFTAQMLTDRTDITSLKIELKYFT
jgi:hypothetical protein